MPKIRKTINGYRVPDGRGAVAIAKACQLIMQQPGIQQRDLLHHVNEWMKTSQDWLGASSAKSPAGHLWERKKVGRSYRLYPNDFTAEMGDPRLYAAALSVKYIEKDWKAAGCPQPGDLVMYMRPTMSEDFPPELCIFLGFEVNAWRPDARCVGGRQQLEELTQYDSGPFAGLMSRIMVKGTPTTAGTGDLHRV